MRYIKSFETEAAYEAGKGDLSIPYVAYTQDDEQVHYARRLEDLYNIVGTLVPGTESFNFKLNESTTITPTIIGNRFVYNWTGNTITNLNRAFNGKTSLVSIDKFDEPVVVSASTQSICYNCSNLSKPFFFSGQTSIGQSAFEGCSGFTGSLTIPNSVTKIDTSAFFNCSGLNGTLTIGNSVTTIGGQAFWGCSGFNGSLTIPDSVTTIGTSAFRNCSGFTGSLTIGNSVTTIGEYAFYNCSGFTGSLIIPNSVTSIGYCAFQNCYGFNGSLTIGNSVTSIGYDAFGYCTSLTSITCLATTPPTLGTQAFHGYNCPIYVPATLVETYKTASGWSLYASRIQAIPTT